MQKNRIELAGYITARPELRYLPSGTKVANVRMGETYRYTGKEGQQQSHTNWHSLTFYDDLADAALGCEKGDGLAPEATINTGDVIANLSQMGIDWNKKITNTPSGRDFNYLEPMSGTEFVSFKESSSLLKRALRCLSDDGGHSDFDRRCTRRLLYTPRSFRAHSRVKDLADVVKIRHLHVRPRVRLLSRQREPCMVKNTGTCSYSVSCERQDFDG